MPLDDLLGGPRRRKSPLVLPLVVVAAFVLLGGSFLLGRWSAGSDEGGGGWPAALGLGGDAIAEAPVEAEPEAEPAPEPESVREVPMGEVLPDTDGLRRVVVEIKGSLTASLNAVLGSEVAEPLAQVTTRLLVWWVDVSRELQPGDRIEILYELPEREEPVVHALRFDSGRLGKRLEAYRHHADGEPWARYYDADGAEVELRLQGSPIEGYEQITSLLRDGRRHKGVDFKAPVGTTVRAPFSGVVKRRNFNYRFNGGSIDYTDDKGRRIIFLHLEKADVKVGQRVRKGDAIGTSGNTGRSFAPHLHYQIESPAGRVLDPFEVHETYRKRLPAAAQAAFAEEKERLISLLEAGGATEVSAAAE